MNLFLLILSLKLISCQFSLVMQFAINAYIPKHFAKTVLEAEQNKTNKTNSWLFKRITTSSHSLSKPILLHSSFHSSFFSIYTSNVPWECFASIQSLVTLSIVVSTLRFVWDGITTIQPSVVRDYTIAAATSMKSPNVTFLT